MSEQNTSTVFVDHSQNYALEPMVRWVVDQSGDRVLQWKLGKQHDETGRMVDKWVTVESFNEVPEPGHFRGFERGLADLINRHSMENGSNTPDHLLAKYLKRCLDLWNEMTLEREHWYGINLYPGISVAELVSQKTNAAAVASVNAELNRAKKM